MKDELQKIMNEIIALQWSNCDSEEEIVENYEAIVELCQNLERRSAQAYDTMLSQKNGGCIYEKAIYKIKMKEEMQKISNKIIALQLQNFKCKEQIVEIYELIIEFCHNLEKRSSEVYDTMLEQENDNDDVEFEKYNNK